MFEDKPRRARLYGYVTLAGSGILFAGCFCPIEAYSQRSAIDFVFKGLSELGAGPSSSLLDGLFCLVLLITAARSLLGVLTGRLDELRSPAVQAWVVLLVFYSHHFGTPFPIHMGTGWGWSVLFLGATLFTFGAFRAAMESEPTEDADQKTAHGAGRGKRSK